MFAFGYGCFTYVLFNFSKLMFEEERRIGFILGFIVVIALIRFKKHMRLNRSFCRTYFVLNCDSNRILDRFEMYSFKKEWAFDKTKLMIAWITSRYLAWSLDQLLIAALLPRILWCDPCTSRSTVGQRTSLVFVGVCPSLDLVKN